MTHVLDRPVWSALSTRQTALAVGGERARGYATDIGPLAASRDDSAESLAEFATLVAQRGGVLLLQADDVVLPPGTTATLAAEGVQMVGDALVPLEEFDPRIVRLGADDVEEMVALATLTKPGPFLRGTPRLGGFWGVKEEGRLVAMAGERMKQPGFTEVSGVCSHPDVRGRGYARLLSAVVATRIAAAGETPYLHAYAANAAAIALYESLGFRLRTRVNVAVLEPAA